jgi:hypothetical protein
MKRSFLRLQVFNRCFNSIERKPVADCSAEFPITLNFFIELGAFIAHRTSARTAKRSNPHWSPVIKTIGWANCSIRDLERLNHQFSCLALTEASTCSSQLRVWLGPMARHNIVRGFDDGRSCSRKLRDKQASAAHVPAKWIRFADKDMRRHENLRLLPVISDHLAIQYDREAP